MYTTNTKQIPNSNDIPENNPNSNKDMKLGIEAINVNNNNNNDNIYRQRKK